MEILAVLKLKEEDMPALQRLAANPGLLTKLIQKADEEQTAPLVQEQKTIDIKTSQGITRIIENNITFLTGNGNSVVINYYSNSANPKPMKLITGKNLNEYSYFTENKNFFRCHQSYMVNLNHVKVDTVSHCFVITQNGQHQSIPISREKWRANKTLLLNFPNVLEAEIQ